MAESPSSAADDLVMWSPTQYKGYSVSDRGDVRGPRGRILRPNTHGWGYLTVTVTGAKCAYVHQLVCIAFHGPRPTPMHQVAHGNGDPADNRVANLRWATPAENSEDARRHGTFFRIAEGRVGELHHNARLTSKDVATIRAEYATGLVSLRALAERFEVHKSHIHRIVKKKAWSAADVLDLPEEEEVDRG